MTSGLVYRQYGGSLQVEIKTFEDLLAAVGIPETQWIATACPVAGLNCDPRFLAFADTDRNSRIRVEELRNAVAFAKKMLAQYAGCDARSDSLVLEHLTKDADTLRATAAMVLETLGAGASKSITLAQVRASEKALRDAGVNGDGIVAPATITDAPLADLAKKIMGAYPEAKNRAGLAGFSPAMLATFREQRAAALAHRDQRAAIFVWGDESLARALRVRDVKPRLDEYFLQCRLVATQPDAAERFRLGAERLDVLLGDPEALGRALAALPVAQPLASGELVWAKLNRAPALERIEAFGRDVVDAVYGPSPRMTEAQWRDLAAKSDAILAWQATFDAAPLVKLAGDLPGIAPDDLAKLEAMCAADLAHKTKLDAIDELEKLILYQRWLLTLANNFISMPDLYHPKKMALFERGYLVLAGRKFTFSVLVPDRAAHTRLTEQGTTFLAYVKVQKAESDGAPYEVAVPVTAGTSAGFEVGKRGIFIDHEGKEFDAIVTHLVRQPVSLWESVTMPFVRLGRFVSNRIQSIAASADESANQRLESAAATSATAGTHAALGTAPPTAAAPPAAAAPAAPPGGAANIVAIASIAIAAVSAALASILGLFAGMTVAQRINAAIALVALVCLPSGFLGWLKLRRRNLALVLEGSGWALNDQLKVTRELAGLITRRPARPKDSRVERFDMSLSLRARDDVDEPEEGMTFSQRLVVTIVVVAAMGWILRAPLGAVLNHVGWYRALVHEVAPPSPATPARPASTHAATATSPR